MPTGDSVLYYYPWELKDKQDNLKYLHQGPKEMDQWLRTLTVHEYMN